MTAATLIVAVVGVVLAAGSLIWQAMTFVLSGPRVRVTLEAGLAGPGGVMVGPLEAYTIDGRAALEAQGYTERVVVVRAINDGRSRARVDYWLILFGNQASFSNPLDPRNPELPYRLEPGESAIWLVRVADLDALQRKFVDRSAYASLIWAVVRLGTGRESISRGCLLFRDGEVHPPPRPPAAPGLVGAISAPRTYKPPRRPAQSRD
jgi:hypothetical protein